MSNSPDLKVRVSLQDVIGPAFYPVHKAIKNMEYTHIWLPGGRGSVKSSFCGVEIVLGVMNDPKASAVAVRRVGNTLRGSVYEQIAWAIEMLGVGHLWKGSVSPLSFKYLPTGQRIMFRGLDDPKKLKSTKAPAGTYFKLIWFEEMDEFQGMSSIRSAIQTFQRGGDKFTILYSYNPPKRRTNWVNAEARKQRKDRLVWRTDYRSVPPSWLGEAFLAEAEQLKEDNYDAYRHEYLAHELGTGGEVFLNLVNRPITDEEIARFDQVRRGLDFGYGGHPTHLGIMHHDLTRGRLYIFGEFHKYRASLASINEFDEKSNPNKQRVTGDSAQPRDIDTLHDMGMNIKGAIKGQDSVRNGMRYLEDLIEIVIDETRAPNTYREFSNYELDEDGNGGYKEQYPDRDNHSIDAVRYALENDVRPSGIVRKRKDFRKNREGPY